MSTEIQQKLAAAHKQWKQEHDTVVQETVKQALAKVKHEYESMYVFAHKNTCMRMHTHTSTDDMNIYRDISACDMI